MESTQMLLTIDRTKKSDTHYGMVLSNRSSEIMSFKAKFMQLKAIMLRKISQSQINK